MIPTRYTLLITRMHCMHGAGYGSRSPGDCWLSAALIAAHSVEAIILDSLVLGIALARIAHPKNRGRTILISDCAIITRRDGVLKLWVWCVGVGVRVCVDGVTAVHPVASTMVLLLCM